MFRSARAMAWIGFLLCFGVISSQGNPSGDTNEGAASPDADNGEVDSMDSDEGSFPLASKLNFKIKYEASSRWGEKYTAEKAMQWTGGYWCSKRNDPAPAFWWISFDKPVQIVEIRFAEKYFGASFEFYGSDDTNACGKTGETLIEGKRYQINGRKFNNTKAYHCYGLKVTKLAKTRYGSLATIRQFRFRVRGFQEIMIGGDIIGMRGQFFEHAGLKYILFEKEATWDEAQKTCQQLGRSWYLASMSGRQEFDEMVTKLQKLRSGSGDSCQDSWIGLSRDGDTWYWNRGRSRKTDSNDSRWAAGEPKVEDPATVHWRDQANYAFIRFEGSGAKLYSSDRYSTKLCSFLCEK